MGFRWLKIKTKLLLLIIFIMNKWYKKQKED